MRSAFALTLAAVLAMLATESTAGPGSSSSGGSRASAPTSTRGSSSIGAGAASRAAPAASVRSAAGSAAGTRTTARPPSARPYGQLGTRSIIPARRSLLASGTPPSPRLTQIIRERERSGPGWIGTAVLIALMSQHDLSAADRNWIQEKIDARDAEEEGDEAQGLLPPSRQPMSLTGATQLRAGQSATIAVASGRTPAEAVACYIEGATTQPVVTYRDRVANHTWTPERAGAYIFTCRTDKYTERRVLRVAENN